MTEGDGLLTLHPALAKAATALLAFMAGYIIWGIYEVILWLIG